MLWIRNIAQMARSAVIKTEKKDNVFTPSITPSIVYFY